MSFRFVFQSIALLLMFPWVSQASQTISERLPEFPSVFEILVPSRGETNDLVVEEGFTTSITKREMAQVMRRVISKISANLSKEEDLNRIEVFAFSYMKQNMAIASGYRMIPLAGGSSLGCLVAIDPTAFAKAMPLLMPNGKLSLGTLEGYVAHEIAHCYEHKRVIAEGKKETKSQLSALLPTSGLGFHRDYELVADVFSLMYMKKYSNENFASFAEDLRLLRGKIAPSNSLYSYNSSLDHWIKAVAKDQDLVAWDEIMAKVKQDKLR